MKKRIKFISMLIVCFTVANSLFAQSSNDKFNQHPDGNGTFVGKVIRSCFGGNASKAEVYVVVKRADWCLVCQKKSDRVEAILPNFKDKPIAFIPNDLTDDNSKKSSAKYLKKLHIYDVVLPVKETGVMIVINAKTRQVIDKVSLAEANKDIEAALDNSLNKSKI